jgi:hypothetical protein
MRLTMFFMTCVYRAGAATIDQLNNGHPPAWEGRVMRDRYLAGVFIEPKPDGWLTNTDLYTSDWAART